jgi:NADP-dependent 3-hydroxy acid dehydrogenase YdfG
MSSLAGKKVLITGGTTGIGLAIAKVLAADGARLVLIGRDRKDLDAAVEEVGALGGELHGQQADTARADDVGRVFAEANRVLGGLDVLICNAAVAADGIGEMSDEDWRYVLDVNIAGYLACVRAALATMKGQSSGAIVLIGSMSSEVREKGSSVYVATKGAIQAFAAALRKEVNETGIHVTLIEPGAVSTDMASGSPEDQRKAIAEEKMLLPEDIATCVRFVLGLPSRCDVVTMQVRPHRQLI